MTPEELFDFAATELERMTSFNRLEARGTLHLALQEVGFDSRSIDKNSLEVVFTRIMPDQLSARGIGDAQRICQKTIEGLRTLSVGAPNTTSPDAIFGRLTR